MDTKSNTKAGSLKNSCQQTTLYKDFCNIVKDPQTGLYIMGVSQDPQHEAYVIIDTTFRTPISWLGLLSIALQYDLGRLQVVDGNGLSYPKDCYASSGEEKSPKVREPQLMAIDVLDTNARQNLFGINECLK